MKKTLLLLSLIPLFGSAQLSESETLIKENQKDIFSAFQLAGKVNNNNLHRATSEKLDSIVYQEFYDPEFFKAFKYEYIYNEQGQETAEYIWMYDFSDDTIVKTNFTYNGSNQLIASETISNFWGSWENNRKKHYIYDVNGNLDTLVDSLYDSDLAVYKLDRTFAFTYDVNDNVTEVYVTTEPTVGQTTTTYYADQQLLISYNVDQTISNVLLQSYVDPSFEDRGIYNFSYTGLNSTGTTLEEYNSWSSMMEDNGSLTKHYDLTILKSNLVLPVSLMYIDYNQKIGEDLIGSYVNKLDSVYFNDEAGDLNSITYYYYSENTNNLSQLEINSVKLYPNPSTGIFHISTANTVTAYQVYDLTGKIVAEVSNHLGSTIDLSHLSNGMYQIAFSNNSNQIVKTERISISK